MALTLTDVAAHRVQEFLTKRGHGIGLRVGVKTTGCSGLAYKLEFIDEVLNDDVVFESQDIKIVINKEHLLYVDGTVLNYTKEGLEEGFKFINPNVKAECGCGESFTV